MQSTCIFMLILVWVNFWICRTSLMLSMLDAGLINQHYSHIAAFTLSSAIGAQLVLAPALQRDSFGSYFSMHKEQNEVTWTPTSVSLLLDEDRIIEEWQAHGMQVHKVGHPPEWVFSACNALAAVATDLLQVQSDYVHF